MKTMRNEVPEEFQYQGKFENGPRRDVAREFYDLVQDLGWMRDGPDWDAFMGELLKAREAGLKVAEKMLR